MNAENLNKDKYTDMLDKISNDFKVLKQTQSLQKKLNDKQDENQMVLDDSEDAIIRDFLKISELALDEYWLNEEEDDAWKNL